MGIGHRSGLHQERDPGGGWFCQAFPRSIGVWLVGVGIVFGVYVGFCQAFVEGMAVWALEFWWPGSV